MHMPEPVAVRERMLYWSKPGGVVAAQEFDFGAIAVGPLCPAMTEFNRLLRVQGPWPQLARRPAAARTVRRLGARLPDGTSAEAKYLPLKALVPSSPCGP